MLDQTVFFFRNIFYRYALSACTLQNYMIWIWKAAIFILVYMYIIWIPQNRNWYADKHILYLDSSEQYLIWYTVRKNSLKSSIPINIRSWGGGKVIISLRIQWYMTITPSSVSNYLLTFNFSQIFFLSVYTDKHLPHCSEKTIILIQR